MSVVDDNWDDPDSAWGIVISHCAKSQFEQADALLSKLLTELHYFHLSENISFVSDNIDRIDGRILSVYALRARCRAALGNHVAARDDYFGYFYGHLSGMVLYTHGGTLTPDWLWDSAVFFSACEDAKCRNLNLANSILQRGIEFSAVVHDKRFATPGKRALALAFVRSAQGKYEEAVESLRMALPTRTEEPALINEWSRTWQSRHPVELSRIHFAAMLRTASVRFLNCIS